MAKTTTAMERGESPARTYDEKSLRRLRHRDAVGLAGLMDDYHALADELEVVGPPTDRRAA
jgi:hypothetical protein